jgi:hypothetical protein
MFTICYPDNKQQEIVRVNTFAHQALEDCIQLPDEEQWASMILLGLHHLRR